MDGKGKKTSFWGCRVTKMPSLEEKIKLKKHPSKRCSVAFSIVFFYFFLFLKNPILPSCVLSSQPT
jgi:hypothetical protein